MNIYLLIFAALSGLIVVELAIIIINGRIYPAVYKKFYPKKYENSYSPTAAFFIPFKGADDTLQETIKKFLTLKENRYSLFFLVESKDDPAYPIINKIVEGHEGVELIVAGRAKNCGQKNLNLIKGIEASGEKADLYIFLDNDTTLTGEQIRKLILPLSRQDTAASCGFQWAVLNRKNLSDKLYSCMNSLQFFSMSIPWFNTIWGGATVIKRSEFEELKMKEYWSKTVVDDMSLQQFLISRRKNTVFVPDCISDTVKNMGSVKDSVAWFKRQILFIKYYAKLMWFLLIGHSMIAVVNLIAAIPLFIGALVTSSPVLIYAAAISLGFTFSLNLFAILLKKYHHDNFNLISWTLYFPFFIFLVSIAILLSLFTNKLEWSGITYLMKWNGVVKKVIR